jgi:hypothetical protein
VTAVAGALLQCACAAPPPEPAHAPWLDTPQHAEFRQRVIELALIYGDSSGIDPQGWRIETRRLAPLAQHCAQVKVRVSRDGEPATLREVRACEHGVDGR